MSIAVSKKIKWGKTGKKKRLEIRHHFFTAMSNNGKLKEIYYEGKNSSENLTPDYFF